MIKILNLMPVEGGAGTFLARQFLDMLPEGFVQVDDPLDADISFAQCDAL